MDSRPLFRQHGKRPILVCSLSDRTPAELQATMRNAVFDGADAFLLHTENLLPEFRNRETLSQIFSWAGDRPVMSLNYLYDGKTAYDEIAAFQLVSAEAGAACIDVPADAFSDKFGMGDPAFGYTEDEDAVKKQMEYIGAIHDRGAEVLASYHQFGPYVPSGVILERAKKMLSRGADFIKVAQNIEREDQIPDAITTTIRMNRELDVPSLHIIFGKYGRAHRALAPVFGSSMVLCVQRYTPLSHKDKPLLRATRDLYGNLDFEIDPR